MIKLSSMDTRTFYSVLAIALCCFTFVVTSIMILSVPLPLGSDAYYHLDLSIMLSKGNFTGWWNENMIVNKFPYISWYHIMLFPLAVSPDPYTGLRLLEMIFLPLTFAAVAWITWKISGPKATLITGLILIASWSYVDGAIQARPESIDLLFYPLIIYAALQTKKKWFAGLTIATIYNHNFMALSNILGVAIRKLRERKWWKTMLIATIIILPAMIVSIIYIPGAWSKWSTITPSENPQETLFWTRPWPWIPFYSGITLFGFACLLRRNKTETEKLLMWGLIGNLAMLPLMGRQMASIQRNPIINAHGHDNITLAWMETLPHTRNRCSSCINIC